MGSAVTCRLAGRAVPRPYATFQGINPSTALMSSGHARRVVSCRDVQRHRPGTAQLTSLD